MTVLLYVSLALFALGIVLLFRGLLINAGYLEPNGRSPETVEKKNRWKRLLRISNVRLGLMCWGISGVLGIFYRTSELLK